MDKNKIFCLLFFSSIFAGHFNSGVCTQTVALESKYDVYVSRGIEEYAVKTMKRNGISME